MDQIYTPDLLGLCCQCNKMANLQRGNANCVSQEEFYKEVEELKRQKTKDSKITLYLEDDFFDKAKSFLKEKMVNQLELSQNDREEPSEVSLLTKWEDATITREQWIYKKNKVFTQDNKEVIPKQELFQVLSHTHCTDEFHTGEGKLQQNWLLLNYAEVNQKVINIFVKMCKFHAEQKSVTSNVKLVKQPMQAPTFLHMIEIDKFRKCPCECKESHTWAMNITNHHTKHVTLYPLTAKSGERVLQALQEYCFTYGYPRNILCDNGKEFCNKNIDTFCLNNGITIKHGAPRTPQTQGLIERSNRSCKEDIRRQAWPSG